MSILFIWWTDTAVIFALYLYVRMLAVAAQVCPLPRVLVLLNPLLPLVLLPPGLFMVLATAFFKGILWRQVR